MIYNGEQITVGVHVDDSLVTCAVKEGLTEVLRILRAEFKEVKMNSYLGMRITVHEHGIYIDMEAYIKNVMEACNVSGAAATPHRIDLFEESESDTKLDESDKKAYHSRVMKILYAVKRC